MTLHLGTVKPGRTIYIPFDTFSGAGGGSITMTGLAVTDIEVYKDGSVTQRASDSGYTLLDTDGIDFDGLTGIHGISINLADNTTAGFWSCGARYFVVISTITVDTQTVSFIAATFNIGFPDAVINTTIATLASQTSFTLTAGPAEANALVGCPIWIQDVASDVQGAYGIITAYAATTKTVTLLTAPTFTIATTDNVSVFLPANSRWIGAALPANATVGTVTNLTNAPTSGDLTATMKTSVTTAATAATPTAAAVTGAVGSVTGNVGGNVTGTIGGLTAGAVADILTTQMTEAYAADGTAPTLAQALFLIQQSIGDFSISGTTITVKKLDGTTTAATYTLNDATDPTSRTRAS